MRNKSILIFLILFCFSISAPEIYAQPKIPKEKIPTDIHPDVKKQIERLYSSDPVERGYGAYYLGEMGENAISAIPFLRELLYDSPSLATRYVWQDNWWKTSPGQEAAEAIAKIDKSAVNLLLDTLKDRDPNVRMNALFALNLLLDALRDRDNPQAVEALILALKDKDPGVRTRAAEALTKIWDSRAVEPLLIAIKDEYPGVRMNAALAMGFIKNKRFVEPLISALNDKVMLVRRYAAMSLIQVGDERASSALHAALKDEDSEVRQCAATALGKIKDTKAVDELIRVLNERGGQKNRASWSNPSGSDTNTRSSAALALGDIGGARAIEVLINVLRDDDLTVSMNAIISLQKITKQNFGPVAPLEEDHIKKWEEWWKENKEKFEK